ncbi:ricin-type beta-trefoil lectin domain protein [Saccharothrix sp. HUAS TT1]|uniref:ricin-type beta-trefoil lectin domain protein n=1 Tax=unclassified Saccharothrix TaxID=2593673 RepID=UPI00345BDC49
MRALPTALAALLLTALTAAVPGPAAFASDEVVIGSVGTPGMALSVDAAGGVVELRPRSGGPEQEWRVHTSDDGQYLTVTSRQAAGCLTAPSAEVLVLECIGAPSQSWVAHPRPDGSRLLENAAHPGQCLTGRGPLEAVGVAACAPGDRSQHWRW